MIHLLLQAAQAAQTVPEPITASTLLYAIAAALVAIGGLLAWIIKTMVPKVLDTLEKRTDALTRAVEVLPELVREIRNDIRSSVESAKDQIIEAVRNDKIENLAAQIKEPKA